MIIFVAGSSVILNRFTVHRRVGGVPGDELEAKRHVGLGYCCAEECQQKEEKDSGKKVLVLSHLPCAMMNFL